MRELSLWQDSTGLWLAECAEIPGLRVKGTTKEEAMAKIASALRMYSPCRCENDEDRQ